MHRALRAREELVAYFQQGVTTARQQLAAGQELTGMLGRLVSAQDEEGNRWVGLCLGFCLPSMYKDINHMYQGVKLTMAELFCCLFV